MWHSHLNPMIDIIGCSGCFYIHLGLLVMKWFSWGWKRCWIVWARCIPLPTEGSKGFILQPSALLVMVENIFEALLVPGWIHCFSNNWCFFNYYNTSLLQNFNWVCSIGEGCFVTAAESGWWRWWRWSRSGQLGDLQKDWGVSEWNPWSVKCPWHEQVVWGQVWGGMLLYDGLKPRGWIDIWDCQWNEETSIFMNYNTKMSVLSVRSHRNFSEGDM